ncbi:MULTISPECIES: glycine cleavage system protein GcvH [unclassified Beijerinckia]|uniref:glycine cleavage system protein GcvH n=1 Tax=unclassified Beijerinckia TaxID=2638183 RepID=UPI000895A525|nr:MULTISPECIES: glycine cleavage system protein GcvH [unclassified Beijerinckia]MDH7797791.1 glycine cleavage system H protein [Beijerinckia sp. GAS462]SEC98706.1 glycine cleavage system H protein [Beijerinckia sp. 28-YEA-48]
MSTTYYTQDHEYIRVDGDIGIVGISDHAQQQLGDIVFVELPASGKIVGKGEQTAVVESVKAASEIYAPVGGEVIEINSALESEPAAVNEDAAGKGWFLKLRIKDQNELAGLMDEAAYAAFVKTLD